MVKQSESQTVRQTDIETKNAPGNILTVSVLTVRQYRFISQRPHRQPTSDITTTNNNTITTT